MINILLIIPCYNEETRINFQAFEEGAKAMSPEIGLHFLYANDGSTDTTHKLLEANAGRNLNAHNYHLAANAGKGNAIQEAYQETKKTQNFANYNWIGYWDADLATPLDEIPRMLKFREFYPKQDVSAIWGARISRLGSKIKRQMHRHYLGRIFVTIVSNVLNVKAYDSQCGAKLFTPAAAEIAFQEPFISRWIFDVEILLRLKEEKIIEFPLFFWEDVPGSKVKVFREMLRVLIDLFKIKNYYR